MTTGNASRLGVVKVAFTCESRIVHLNISVTAVIRKGHVYFIGYNIGTFKLSVALSIPHTLEPEFC